MGNSWVLRVVVATLVLVLAWAAIRTWVLQGSAVTPLDQTRTEAPDATASAEPRKDPLETALVEEAEMGSRTDASRWILAGRITGSGQPLDGARVTWTSLSPRLDDQRFGWRASDVKGVVSRTLAADSVEGEFAFEREPEGLGRGGQESVLWVTAPGFLAASVDRDADEPTVALDLRPAAPVRVLVVDTEDRPVPEAIVTLLGLPGEVAEVERDPAGLRSNRSRRALVRTAVSSEEGAAVLPAVPGRVRLAAEHGALRSAPYVGPLGPEIVLRLGSTFSAGGRVTLTAGTSVPPEDVWVECAGARGFQVTHLAKVPLEGDLSWGMPAVPWIECDRLVFRLHGGLISNREVFLPRPDPGGHVELDFDGVGLGGLFRAQVRNPEGDAIAGAIAYTSVQLPGGEWHGRGARTDSTGLAEIPGSGPGEVWLQVEAAGFVPATDGPFEVLPGNEYGAVEVTLLPAASVSGRCTFQGQPVERFDVLHWTEAPQRHVVASFDGREDGRFELDEVAAGPLFLRAHAPDLAASESIFVEVVPGSPVEVELALRQPGIGRGRVVDAATGEPIAGASLQAQDRERRRSLRPIGPATLSANDGSFELHRLNPAETGVLVEAPGYAKRHLLVVGDPEQPVELGDVKLDRERSLRVRLVADPPRDFTGFAFSAAGDGTTVDVRPFPASGVLEVEGLPPGTWRLTVHPTPETWIHRSGALAPGRDWEVVFDVSQRRELRVEVDPDEQGRVPEDLYVAASYRDADDSDRTAVRALPRDGELVWTDLPEQDLYLVLRDSSLRVLDTRSLPWEGSPTQTVRLDPRARPARVRVVDKAGSPVPGVQVVAMAASSPDRWSSHDDTDSDGWARLGGVDFQDAVVVLSHPSHGVQLASPVDLSTGSVVVLDVWEGLHVRLMDGSSPSASADVDLWDADSSFWIGRYTTDRDGRLDVDRVQGVVAIEVVASGLWPTRTNVPTRSSQLPIVVETLRTGSVLIVARSPDGAPTPGTTIDLHSEQLAEAVSTWVADQRVEARDGLVTGPEGSLLLRGLPRGHYSWLAQGPDELHGSGSLEVRAGETTRVVVVLGP